MNNRLDNKGRRLKVGESQRKDGRYAYKYKTVDNKIKFVYSWRLTETDVTPRGKKKDKSLREKEREIHKDLKDGIIDCNITVSELIYNYLNTKGNIRTTTKQSYDDIYDRVAKCDLGSKQIKSINQVVAKKWVVGLKKSGLSFYTIKGIVGLLKSSFKMAVQNDFLRKNPFDFKLTDVIANDSIPREALSSSDEKKLLEFIRANKKFKKRYDTIYILLNTGLRVSELCGLTKNDVDFKNNQLHVNKQLLKQKNGDYMIADPKTKSGNRIIPMTDEVAKCFKNIMENGIKCSVTINGLNNFIILNRNGSPSTLENVKHYLTDIKNAYNAKYNSNIKLTAHILRHTFCTKMALHGMNPKALQYIMGHSNISITLNVYTHVTSQNAQNEMKRVINSMN